MSQGQLEVTDVLGRRIVTIERDPFTIGRAAGSDLHLPSAEVSRDHAEIVSEADGYAIRDRGSRYGTYVNDDAVEVRPLVHGDRIRLGRSGGAEIVFLLSGADPALERGSGAVGDLKQVTALLEGLRALSSARVLDDVLTLVMDSAIDVSGAERGFIMLANDAAQLEFTMGRSRARKTLPGSGFETSRKIPEEVFTTREGADRGRSLGWRSRRPAHGDDRARDPECVVCRAAAGAIHQSGHRPGRGSAHRDPLFG